MRLIVRRIALYVITAIVAITINFFLPRLMPGNPALAVQYAVQTPTATWGQYTQYWDHLLHGNLGTSLNPYPASVGSLIRTDLRWTIGLVGTATVISFVLGTLLGIAAAWRRGSWLDNTTANPALDSGQVRYAGNDVADIQGNYLGASPDNRTWTPSQPWFAANNVVTLWPNVTAAPLNDPKVRLAVSAGIDRAQLSAQGETGYERHATSSRGLLLPVQNTLLDPAYRDDLPPSGNSAKVRQILTSDGYTMTGGRWMKNGQPIKFSIEDPSSYTDYVTDAQLIAGQLNSEGFEVSFDGVQATQWYSDVAAGNFQAILRWSNQGPTPWDYLELWMDHNLSAPIGRPTAANPYIDPVPNSPYLEYTLLHLTPAS